MVLANALESKDYETQEHSTRLVGMSDAIARHLGLEDAAAQRHPVRRLPARHRQGGHPRGAAAQAAALTARSARSSARIPRSVRASSPTSTPGRTCASSSATITSISTGLATRTGSTEAQIPLGARIVSVVDAFDVMRTGRPYQAARSVDWASTSSLARAARQFDPEMVRALIAVLPADGSAHRGAAARSRAAARSPGRVGRRQTDVAIASWLRGEPGSMVRVPLRPELTVVQPASGLSAVSAPRSPATSASARSATPLPFGSRQHHVGPRLEHVDGIGDGDRDACDREERHVVLAVTDRDRRCRQLADRAQRHLEPGALADPGGQHHRRVAVADHLRGRSPAWRSRRAASAAASTAVEQSTRPTTRGVDAGALRAPRRAPGQAGREQRLLPARASITTAPFSTTIAANRSPRIEHRLELLAGPPGDQDQAHAGVAIRSSDAIDRRGARSRRWPASRRSRRPARGDASPPLSRARTESGSRLGDRRLRAARQPLKGRRSPGPRSPCRSGT